MKQAEILKIMAKEFGSDELLVLNKSLKAKTETPIKFKLMGENLGYLGFTVVIKNISAEGLKIFDVNKVRLIRFEDIESFERAKPKAPRPKHPKPVKPGKKMRTDQPTGYDAKIKQKHDDGYGEPLEKSRPQSGSSFIPKAKRR